MNKFENIVNNDDFQEIKKMIDEGYKFNSGHLDYALALNKPKIANELLNQKIIPTSNSFISFTSSIKLIKELSEYGFISGVNIENYEIFKLLINFGYKLSQLDLLFMTQHYLYVSDVKKYNLVIDNYVIYTCSLKNFYPYDEIIPSKQTILASLKNDHAVSIYKKMFKKYNIKPDADYLRVLLKTNRLHALKIIEYIHKNYFEITVEIFWSVVTKYVIPIILNKYCEMLYWNNYSQLENNYSKINDYYKKWSKTKFNYLVYINDIDQTIVEFYKELVCSLPESITSIEKICDIIAKHNIICDEKLLYLLCFMFCLPENQLGNNKNIYDCMVEITKKHNITPNIESLYLLKTKNKLSDFIYKTK